MSARLLLAAIVVTSALQLPKKLAAPWIAVCEVPAVVCSAVAHCNFSWRGVRELLDNFPDLIAHVFAIAVPE